MCRVGYIDDQPIQYENYRKKLQRRYPGVELILLKDCQTQEDFLMKIYEEQIDVLLIDYKMAGSYGFNGSTLINYINDQVRDLECFILTAVDKEQIVDGLVTKRNQFSKTVFDTEGDDEGRVKELTQFVDILKQSAEVFKNRREQKKEQYLKLLEKKKTGTLTMPEEDNFRRLYQVLSSYGMVEKLPEAFLKSEFEDKLNQLLKTGEAILQQHRE